MGIKLSFSLPISVFVCCCFFACTDQKVDVNQSIVAVWQLENVIENGQTVKKPFPYTGRKEVQLDFHADGRLNGSSSSNNIAGTYTLTGNDSISLSFGYESKIAENVWGLYFAKGATEIKTFEIEKDILKLDYSGNKLIFKKLK